MNDQPDGRGVNCTRQNRPRCDPHGDVFLLHVIPHSLVGQQAGQIRRGSNPGDRAGIKGHRFGRRVDPRMCVLRKRDTGACGCNTETGEKQPRAIEWKHGYLQGLHGRVTHQRAPSVALQEKTPAEGIDGGEVRFAARATGR